MRRKPGSLSLQPLSKYQIPKRGSLLLPAATEISSHWKTMYRPLTQSENAAVTEEVLLVLNEGQQGSSAGGNFQSHSSRAWTEMTVQSIRSGSVVDSGRIPLLVRELRNNENCCEEKPEHAVDDEAEEPDDVFDWRTGWQKFDISGLRVQFIDVDSW